MGKNLRVMHDQISLGQLTRVADIVSLSLKMFLKLKKNLMVTVFTKLFGFLDSDDCGPTLPHGNHELEWGSSCSLLG